VTARGFAAVCAPAVLVGAAIGHATGGSSPAAPAVVAVEARGVKTATGFVVADGRVVTVAHAIDHFRVTVRGADGVPRPAVVLRRDPGFDLALLSVRGVTAGAGLPPRGTHVLVRRDGAQVAAPAVVRRRIDARVRRGDGRLVARRPAMELRADIRAGDSGAPLIQDGRVASVVFGRSRERGGLAYAVDAAVLERLGR
jgi:S1-C subfamily serine protease